MERQPVLKANREVRALADLGFDDQPSPMARQNVLDDRKTEPGTLLGSAILDADAIEAFGQARHMFGRNSGTTDQRP